jgi:hypothetical protein
MPGLPLHPKYPERTCWGCDKYCPAADLACGNGTIRAPHPVELFGDDWLEWSERSNRLPSADDEGDAGAARPDPAVPPRQS